LTLTLYNKLYLGRHLLLKKQTNKWSVCY